MSGDKSRLLERMARLNRIGIALSAERDTRRLLQTILEGAMDLVGADAGTIYTLEGDRLNFEVMGNRSLGIDVWSEAARPTTFEPIALHDAEGRPVESLVVTSAVHRRRTINIPDVYHAPEGYDFSGTHRFDEQSGYQTRSLLAIPMLNHENDIIGVLQLINATNEQGQVVAFAPELQQLAESLASQAAVALTNRRLIDELNALFDSFVRLIATAIDEKSPYTGGHCRRVPELTMMLAEAAARSDHPALKDFHMDEADRHELSVAAWLHDCGKITTPEWVMDKATKLQTIHDRIHEVELRYELLQRDAEIERLRARLVEAGVDPGPEGALPEQAAVLKEELEFLRKANIGGEFMDEGDQQRVQEIARRTIRVNGEERPLLDEDEVKNLCIPKGTLTPEEREVINNHIVATIKMLESLPFPKHLARVPEYAGGHHERMDGRGYPRGLTREQMSIPARVMAIADIFEALTARDRPYKPGKKLSECLQIMGRMKLDQHIDPDLFDVFVREKVYLEYARQFLEPEQIDEVDEAAIPGYTP
ncbi:MAG: GAF domain-containing protein [Gammaproteobacteria bacterium]|nr:MAG: GAF domain-containing protein [Gammaproteobacteria bacterium]